MDITLTVYLLIVAVCAYGFALFAWWWAWAGKASEVYIYVMLLFASIWIEFLVNSVVRWSFVCEGEYGDIWNSIFWKVKGIPMLIILTLIVIRMTQRCANAKHHDREDL